MKTLSSDKLISENRSFKSSSREARWKYPMKKNQMKTANDKLDKRISNRDMRTLTNADQPRKFKL